MGRCMACGQELSAGDVLCPCHEGGQETGWAATNRIMCDLVHRGVAPSRLRPAEREDDAARHPLQVA